MSKSTRKASIGAIFLTVVLDLLGFGLVIPFLAEEARDNFHTTAFVGTLLGAAYSLMQFVFVPVWGRLSDRIGRRPVLVWSVAATALSMAGLGLAIGFGESVAWLFVARIFSGVATANLGTASAYIADITAPEERARGMGFIGMAFGIGFILGPGVGGLLARIPLNGHLGAYSCFAAAALSVVNWIWVFFGLPESLPADARRPRRGFSPVDLAVARRVFADPSLGRAVALNFLVVLSFTELDQTFRYFHKDRFAMDALGTGLLLAAIGVVAAGVQGGLIRRLVKQRGELTVLRGGLSLQALSFAGLAVSPLLGRPALYAASMVLALGNGMGTPTLSGYVSRRADASEQGSVLGLYQSASSLARVFGPALGGLLYGALAPEAPYAAGAAGMLLAIALAFKLR